MSYAKLPLSFEVNQGQTASGVKFLSHAQGYVLFLAADEAVLTLRSPSPAVRALFSPRGGTHGVSAQTSNSRPRASDVVRMRLKGANAEAAVTGADELPGKVNYFLGNDPNKWRTNVPTYAQVRYRDVYPGIDLTYHGSQTGQLEYDFVVAPGADPRAITLRVQRQARDSKLTSGYSEAPLRIAPDGDLVIPANGSEFRFHKPVVFQEKLAADRQASSVSNRQYVGGGFLLRTARNPKSRTQEYEVTFQLAAYDHAEPLVIDPGITFSTYLGGGDDDSVQALALDGTGNVYVAGFTESANFPVSNPLQSQKGGGSCAAAGTPSCDDAFAAKIASDGSGLVWSTYFGGTSQDDAYGLALDPTGNVYTVGRTYSADFPVTSGSLQNGVPGDGVAFVAKLTPQGNALVYSAQFGGTGGTVATAVAVDPQGSAFLTGTTFSIDFPTVSAFQPTCGSCNGSQPSSDAFVAKLNPAGSALAYSTYLGGSGEDDGGGIALDASGDAYVTGITHSSDFPTANAEQPAFGGNSDAFVTELNPTGSGLVFSTYLGGPSGDGGYGVAVDSLGDTYVSGGTYTQGFPTVNAIEPTNTNECAAFLAKFAPGGVRLLFSTYLGGAGNNPDYCSGGFAMALDSTGNAYIAGQTTSADFPQVNSIQGAYAGGTCEYTVPCGDAFVMEVNASGNSILFSTYLGGSGDDAAYGVAVDPGGNVYVGGTTDSTNFPTKNALQTSLGGNFDGFVAKISPKTSSPAASVSPPALTFTAEVVHSTSAEQTVTLTNSGEAPLTIASIATSGDFAETNTCGNSVAADANCAIDITFTPTAAGTRSGTLTISDNASGSPQSVTLSGTGQDFTLTVASGTPSSNTVSPGQAATYTLTVGGEGGFNQGVGAACAGAPSESDCTVSPSSVAPGSNITVTVTTTAPSASAPRTVPPIQPRLPGPQTLLMLAVLLAGIAWTIRGWGKVGASRRRTALMPLAAGLLLVLAVAACGGGGGGGGGGSSNPGTPAGTYTVTVTATVGSGSTALSHSVTLTLNVS